MKIVQDDIWAYEPSHWIVIPTNIGWNAKGENVMGAGVAKEAARRCPGLAQAYGSYCKQTSGNSPCWKFIGLCVMYVMFPTKPFNANAPHLSWRSPASMELIRQSAAQVAAPGFIDDGRQVVLPMVGCGLGGLSPDDVIPVLQSILDDRFSLVVP